MILQVTEHRDAAALGAAPRIAYRVGDDAAAFSRGPVRLTGRSHVLCFELVQEPAADALLHAAVSLDPAAGYVMRCDRVDFPPGGVAYAHTHEGPGIRVLLTGGIRIETQGRVAAYAPFEAWFESGPEPVFAAASKRRATAFVRCLVLPRHLLGERSIRYVRPEDADKPKPQRYTVFVDEPVEEAVAR